MMGFCDLCGCHGDARDQMIDLEQTRMKQFWSWSLSYVCGGCYSRLVDYQTGKKDVFDGFCFAKTEVERMFRTEEQMMERSIAFYAEFDRIEKDARKRCYDSGVVEEDCKKCSNKHLCQRDNEWKLGMSIRYT